MSDAMYDACTCGLPLDAYECSVCRGRIIQAQVGAAVQAERDRCFEIADTEFSSEVAARAIREGEEA